MSKIENAKTTLEKIKNGQPLAYCTTHFSWNELLGNLDAQGEIPQIQVLENLIRIASVLEIYREKCFKGNPIIITSGWRSKSYNRTIGGATASYHIIGLALDFNVKGFTPKQVQEILDSIHAGGMEYAPTWTHIDLRGYKARFKP
jgi:hypothetical protein